MEGLKVSIHRQGRSNFEIYDIAQSKTERRSLVDFLYSLHVSPNNVFMVL